MVVADFADIETAPDGKVGNFPMSRTRDRDGKVCKEKHGKVFMYVHHCRKKKKYVAEPNGSDHSAMKISQPEQRKRERKTRSAPPFRVSITARPPPKNRGPGFQALVTDCSCTASEGGGLGIGKCIQ